LTREFELEARGRILFCDDLLVLRFEDMQAFYGVLPEEESENDEA
jgi:hypothetical protein